ncbi:MAG: hypothetical protein AAFV45_10055 [Pseudomonadota bacterium]
MTALIRPQRTPSTSRTSSQSAGLVILIAALAATMTTAIMAGITA